MRDVEARPGDTVAMRKPHPCGSRQWEVLRVGADVRIRCLGCGHNVLLPRRQFERQAKVVASAGEHRPSGESW